MSDVRTKRRYATAAEAPRGDLEWPELADSRRIPTPYQIFKQQPGDKYSKKRFYELVKLYHPDRNATTDGSNPCGCSKDEMLERYRLIVAAHTILSDPAKRQAYDRHGAGWAVYREGVESGEYKYSTFHRWRTGTAKSYQHATYDDPMYNATWEDWERWYERQGQHSRWSQSPFHPAYFTGRREQNTIYAGNTTFISLIAILAALGGIGQATRVGKDVSSRQERLQAVSEANGRHLMDARENARGATDAGDIKRRNIARFMQDREGYAEGEFDSRTTSKAEDEDAICSSAKVKDRDLPPFWKRPPEVE